MAGNRDIDRIRDSIGYDGLPDEAPTDRKPPEEGFGSSLRDKRENEPTADRVYRVALALYEPTRVSDIAERAACSKNGARTHLDRLVELGVLTKASENPDRYERNESYFEWRRRHELAQLSDRERRDRIAALLRRHAEFKELFGADTPDEVDPLALPADDVEARWLALTKWESVRREVRELRSISRDVPDEGVV